MTVTTTTADLIINYGLEQEAKVSRSPERLRALAHVTDIMILMYVARNPHTPGDVLRKLATKKDQDDLILCSVAENPSTPTDALIKLIYTSSACALDVRFCVTQNPNVTSAVLRKIAEGDDLAARVAASKL